MPKLKKFRVVNLIYNDIRHLYDQVFDFGDGSDAMMLLANGGGKTVLTQMMLQPVIPKTDLKTRKFADYFKNNSKPTLLISEWALDDEAGTVLTGLVIKHQVRKKRGQDDNRELLNIHAFVIQYHYNDTYNIDTVPGVSRDSQGRKHMQTYEEILSKLQKHQGQYPAYVSQFHWSDSREAKDLYGKKLAEFGINQQEWRDNILKINKEEAGLQSFFDDAKTSSTLLKRKILPNIESKLDEHIRDKVEIQDLVKSHARELVKNDRIIKDQKLYESFMEESRKYDSQTAALALALEAHEGALLKAAQMYRGLGVYLTWIDEELGSLNTQVKDNRREINRINFEEDCYKYYLKESDLRHKHSELLRLEEVVEQRKRLLHEADYRSKCMKALGLLEELAEFNMEISESQMKLEQIYGEEASMDIQGLVSVLVYKYRAKRTILETKHRELVDSATEAGEQIEKLTSQLHKLREKMAKEQKEYGAIESRLKSFDKKVAQYGDRYPDFEWEKHPLLQTYERQVLDDFLNTLAEQLEMERRREGMILAQREDCQKKAENLLAEKNALDLEVVKLDMTLKKSDMDMEAYLSRFEACSTAAEQWGVERERFFEVDYGKDILKEGMRSREERGSHLVIDRSMVLQMAESLKAGHLYTLPDEVAHFLDRHGIDYDYGYKWVREYEGESLPRSLYMDQLPVLPYALVMAHDDLMRFKAAVKEYHLTNVIPVVSHRHIEQALAGGAVEGAEEGILYHTSFDMRLLEETYVTEEIRSLEAKLMDLDSQINHMRKSRNELQEVLHVYKDFHSDYSEDSYQQIMDLNETLQEKIDSSHRRQEGFIKEIDSTNAEMTKLEAAGKKCRKIIGELSIKSDDIGRLTVDYESYLEDCKELREQEKALEVSETTINDCLKNINKHEALQRQKLSASDKVQSDIEETEKAIAKIVVQDMISEEEAVRNPYYEEAIESLASRYDLYARNHGDAENVGKLLKEQIKNRAKCERQLGALEVKAQDLEGLVYEAHLESVLEEERLKAAKELQIISDEVKERRGSLSTLEVTVKEMSDDILDKYVADALVKRGELIDIDFKKRRLANKASYKALQEEQREKGLLQKKAENSKGRIEDLDSRIPLMECDDFVLGEDMTVVELDRYRESVIGTVKVKAAEVKQQEGRTMTEYEQLKSSFFGKNELLTNMFSNLLTGDNAYNNTYVQRVFKQTYESIKRTMEKYAADLSNLDKSRDKLHEFTLSRVSDVYDELKEIDKHSAVELKGKRQKMLHINLPKKETLDTSELNNYLTEVIRKAKKRIEEGELSELETYLDNHLGLEQLFDMYLPIGSIKVKITKIEQNRHSIISWEEVGKVSGGEVFVSVFILFVSLLSYTRGYNLSRKQSGKVLVMDNPFGPVSSEHLLEPLFRIAETYDTQLICFTHINTSAITSQFDLIYSMRVVREMGSNKEHLDVSVTKDGIQGIETVESSLFEIGDGDQLGFL